LLRLQLIDRPRNLTLIGQDEGNTTTQVHNEKSTNRFEEITEINDVKPAALENADYTGAEAKTDPTEIALMRKIDWGLMVRVTRNLKVYRRSSDSIQPTLCTMYFSNYVGRNAIAQARLNNLEKDLGMTGVQFNTTISMYVQRIFWSDFGTHTDMV
jgi:hypothetical protein